MLETDHELKPRRKTKKTLLDDGDKLPKRIYRTVDSFRDLKNICFKMDVSLQLALFHSDVSRKWKSYVEVKKRR